jgi:tight adherence protein B
MLLAILMFLIGAGTVLGAYAAVTKLPAVLAQRKLDRRLSEVTRGLSGPGDVDSDETVVKQTNAGPLPVLDKFVSRYSAGGKLQRLIDQSGVKTTPSAVVLISLVMAAAAGLVAALLTHLWFVVPFAAGAAAILPILFLTHKRTRRMNAFEEMFPEALDLISRALKAGHAFQTAMGMAADEMKEPVGPEFKKTFDQQNYGLPLRDALVQMSERVPLLDVRFFVTAVLIQRETGGNLAEILENLAHVVRERFKILRQVRVHTAHGRFTAWVLLALPAFLAGALMYLNPDHMKLLFTEPMGRMMLGLTVVLQTTGYFWIRKVIKIEV